MYYAKRIIKLIDNYVIARWQNRPSMASFWYLPEPAILNSNEDFANYQQNVKIAPPYFIDYKHKLKYALQNDQGIIVIAYDNPIGHQINPEAAFQYALGLHDMAIKSDDKTLFNKFIAYAEFFAKTQKSDGGWAYDFDWYGSKAPWYSALAQARGASVMFRAFLHTKDKNYFDLCKNALAKFNVATDAGGFLHQFPATKSWYFEEYPNSPTGVINGFMAALISIWELKFWLQIKEFDHLWQIGIKSLITMLPYYTTTWWSLYDLDEKSPIKNVNSPRYHLLELNYLKILSLISGATELKEHYAKRLKQYNNPCYRQLALGQKFLRKIIYK